MCCIRSSQLADYDAVIFSVVLFFARKGIDMGSKPKDEAESALPNRVTKVGSVRHKELLEEIREKSAASATHLESLKQKLLPTKD